MDTNGKTSKNPTHALNSVLKAPSLFDEFVWMILVGKNTAIATKTRCLRIDNETNATCLDKSW